MEAKRVALALPLLAVVLATAFAGGWYINDYSEPDAIVVIPEVRVYKNGELVYHKVGDPPTHNLAKWWFWILGVQRDINNNLVSISVTDVNGQGDTWQVFRTSSFVHSPALWVVVGTGSTTPSYTDYTMQFVGYGPAKLVGFSFDQTNTAWVITISGAITMASTATISEVGLIKEVGGDVNGTYNPTTQSDAYLLFRDVLATPISAAAGDVIEVQYSITIDFP